MAWNRAPPVNSALRRGTWLQKREIKRRLWGPGTESKVHTWDVTEAGGSTDIGVCEILGTFIGDGFVVGVVADSAAQNYNNVGFYVGNPGDLPVDGDGVPSWITVACGPSFDVWTVLASSAYVTRPKFHFLPNPQPIRGEILHIFTKICPIEFVFDFWRQ